jgi:LysW-gamma-L-lysine carboxypeptidase
MDPVKLLKGLLEVYSPSAQEAEAVEYLMGAMRRLGFTAWRDAAGNAVGVLGDGPRTGILLGHIDTVAGFIQVRSEAGRLYGRGAVDAKGPLAAFVAAVAQAGPQPGWRLVVVGAVEEEAATSKGARFVATRWQPEWCVIGEPSQWDRVTLGYKGRLLAHYRLTQPASHTASRARPVAETAATFWQRVVAFADEFNRGRQATFDRLDPSLRRINTDHDGFSETVDALFGFRLPLDLSPAQLRATLAGLAGQAEITFSGDEVAFRADKNTPLVRAFLAAIRESGGNPRFAVKTGTSDMNVVGPVWRCPIVAYGPGDSTLDHTPDEHIVVADYLRGIEVLRRAMLLATQS